ncbi:hypothetical protein D3C81_1791780 [compost metagenome]
MLLDRQQALHQLGIAQLVANQHQVDIAAGMFAALGHRAIDERPRQLPGQRRQGGAQRLADAEGLAHDAQQLGINRAGRVGPVVGLVALPAHGQDARALQALQLTHQAALADLRMAGELVGVEALLRVAVQQAQHLALGCGE